MKLERVDIDEKTGLGYVFITHGKTLAEDFNAMADMADEMACGNAPDAIEPLRQFLKKVRARVLKAVQVTERFRAYQRKWQRENNKKKAKLKARLKSKKSGASR